MSLDGWSTRTNDPVIDVSLITSSYNLLVNTIDTTRKPHTFEYLIEIFREQVENCENEWGVNVASVVTDNAANMVGMHFWRRTKLAFLYKQLYMFSYASEIKKTFSTKNLFLLF